MAHVAGVQIQARTPWPSAASKGYQPLKLTLENLEEEPRDLELNVEGGWGSSGLRLTRSVRVGPRERLEVELLVPAYVLDSREFRMKVVSGADRGYTGGLGSTQAIATYTHLVAVFSGASGAGIRANTWSEDLSPMGSSTSWGQGRWRHLGLHLEADWDADAAVVAGEVSFDDMSRRWEAYSSLDLAVVDLTAGLPPGPELEALMAWARLGGVVVFVGDDANRTLAGVPAVDAWRHERFALAPLDGAPAVQRFQAGFGRLLVAPRDGLLDDPQIAAATLAEVRQRVRTDWTPSPRGSRGTGEGLRPEIPGLGVVPYRTFVVLMIVFALVVGPVNLIWTRRRGKPVALLFTIPGVALVGAVLALGYGFLGQGISIRTHADTVALLDQRSGLVAGAEVRALFAGLAPGKGLVPGQGTGVFPWGVDLMNRHEARYDIRHGQETSLRAGYLPSRLMVRQALLTSRGSKLRLEVDATDGGCAIENGLGVDVEELVVHAVDGDWFRLAGVVEAGGSARLEPLPGPPPAGSPEADLTTFHPDELAVLPRGTWAARTSTPAFRDDCGLELVEVGGSHHLLGILPEGAGR